MNTISASEFLKLIHSEQEQLAIFNTSGEDLELSYASDYLSLNDVQSGKLPEISKTTAIYLLCEYGQISELVALYLETAGFNNVYNVSGGMSDIKKLLDNES